MLHAIEIHHSRLSLSMDSIFLCVFTSYTNANWELRRFLSCQTSCCLKLLVRLSKHKMDTSWWQCIRMTTCFYTQVNIHFHVSAHTLITALMREGGLFRAQPNLHHDIWSNHIYRVFQGRSYAEGPFIGEAWLNYHFLIVLNLIKYAWGLWFLSHSLNVWCIFRYSLAQGNTLAFLRFW